MAEYPFFDLGQSGFRQLLNYLGEHYPIWGPVIGDDGVCRLAPLAEMSALKAQLTFLPLKKLLLPPGEVVWSYQAGYHAFLDQHDMIAVVGLPLCELQAVWYLDRVFAEDGPYLRRRKRFLLVGSACDPTDRCRCQPELMPVSGDLFLDDEGLWALSPEGEVLLDQARIAGAATVRSQLPWPELTPCRQHHLSLEDFSAWQDASLWEREARRCLSCGACSAVCPTCYCFDLLDTVNSRGMVQRRRMWDNCFFAEHGQIAGGFNFRPDRTSRLRFRLEHKRFGFGALRGQNSCVGCGRCRAACPVDIDLDEIIDELQKEAGR